MATTVNNDLIIYNDEAQTAYLERIQDNLDVFNASSNGAMSSDEIASMSPSAASPPMTSTTRTTAELAKWGLR